MCLGDHKGLLAQRNGDGSIRLYVAARQSEHWLMEKGLDTQQPSNLRRALLNNFADWSPKLVNMLRDSDDVFFNWPLHALPLEPAWPTLPGVTLIGDAAHVMPPFLGAGANMAMLDAVELADCLTSDHFSDLTQALNAFEESVRVRMAPIVEQSIATQEILFADDAPAGLVELMNSGT